MRLWQRLFGKRIACVWCESRATRSVKYRELVFPICDRPDCKGGLDGIVPQCQMMKSFDFPAPPEMANRLIRIRNCVRGQR